MRPQSIVRFEQLYIVNLILSVLSGIWSYMRLSTALPPDTPSLLVPATMAIGTAIGLIIGVLLLYFIARRGSEIAKWILIILFVIGVIGVIHSGALSHVATTLSAVILGVALAQIVLQAVCVWLLFRPDAKAWFKGVRTPEDLHDTFS